MEEKQNRPESYDPQKDKMMIQNKYRASRYNLLLVFVMTAVNLVLLLTQANVFFVFSAFVPYLFVSEGMIRTGMYPEEFYQDCFGVPKEDCVFLGKWAFVLALILALAVIGFYVLCYVMSSKNRYGWIIAAVTVFSVDTLILILGLDVTVSFMVDVAFHLWVIFSLLSGISAAKKLRLLEAAEEATKAAETSDGFDASLFEESNPENR